MTKEEFLQLGLNDELATLCSEKSEKELQGYVLKEDYEALQKEKEKLKSDDNELEHLKGEVSKLQEEKAQIEESHLKSIRDIKLSYETDNAIKKLNGRNVKAIKALIDFDKIQFDEQNNLIGIDEQLENLVNAKDSSFLFKEENKDNFKGIAPYKSASNNSHNFDFSQMSYSEQVKFLEQNPNYKIK